MTFWLEKMKKSELQSIEDLAIKAGRVAASGATWPGSTSALHMAATAYGVQETQNRAKERKGEC